jgi:hypothetical protein
MALTLKKPRIEVPADHLAALVGEMNTEARSNPEHFLETHIWPAIPAEILGQGLSPIQKECLEDDLGLNPR